MLRGVQDELEPLLVAVDDGEDLFSTRALDFGRRGEPGAVQRQYCG